jgi:mannose-6-phosphate isomerase-like protein (cupin superfamily)
MKGFIDDIEEVTERNDDFRRVIYTGPHLQLVLMALQPGQEIGSEVHSGVDQFFRIEKGKGVIDIDGVRTKIKSDSGVLVPAGARHNLINTGDKTLKLYTLYAPPHHRDGLVRQEKLDTKGDAEHFDGKTTE